MTRDDIIRMAREAGIGFEPLDGEYCDALGIERGTICRVSDVGITEIERFAILVAAAEREACAKVCAEIFKHTGTVATADDCAVLIRARFAAPTGQTQGGAE